MQSLIRHAAEGSESKFFVSSAHPRLVDGKPSKNPRYLQMRSDLQHPHETYLAGMATRLRRQVPPGQPIHNPVTAVLPGRRNISEAGIPCARRVQPDPLFRVTGVVHGIHLQYDRQIALDDRVGCRVR